MRNKICILFLSITAIFALSLVSCRSTPSRLQIPSCPDSEPSEEQWATVEKMRMFASEGKDDELLLLYTKGQYREYARQQLRTNRQKYLSGILLPEQKMAEVKKRFLSGDLPLCFKWEDGMWKFHER